MAKDEIEMTKEAIAGVVSENWDDDFDFAGAGQRKNKEHAATIRMSVATEDWDAEDRTKGEENWDDDYLDRTEKRSSIGGKLRAGLPVAHQHESWDDEFDFNDDHEIGVGSEEDRTVTPRSRRPPLSHSSPPPPVPTIPLLLAPSNTQFPHSPTISVFSVPDSNSLRSTAPLRPSLSRNLKHLPPSPPIHRERRRLRKKSRPQPDGMIELSTYPFSDSDQDYPIPEEHDPATTPPPSPPPLLPTVPQTPSQSTSGALLSRIGSVKHWRRRKRSSTTPSEAGDRSKEAIEDHLTPRPRSSLSSLLHTNIPPPPSSNWFFRSSSPSTSKQSPSTRSGSMTDLSIRASLYTHSSVEDNTPSKLLKRKSLGFGHLSKNLADKKPAERPMSMQPHRMPSTMRNPPSLRHASYGTTRSRLTDPSLDDLPESAREPRKSIEEKQKGSRGFIGSVRRLSLIGRHRRNKSENSVDMLSCLPSESIYQESTPTLPPLPPLPPMQLRPKTPPLLPPIELQPPSPPKTPTNTTNPLPDVMFSPNSSILSPLPSSPTTFPLSPRLRSPPKTPKSSPQTASLGRSTISPTRAKEVDGIARRSSLSDLKSDLKIPTRISQAQVNLKRDLGMVRDFAVYIEQLKRQQEIYQELVNQVEQKLDAQLHSQPPPPAPSNFFNNLTKPKVRARSNTNPTPSTPRYKELAAEFYTINSKYRISWECAELLVALADGTAATTEVPRTIPSTSVSAPMVLNVGKKGRERAITLAGDEPSPLPVIRTGSSGSGQQSVENKSKSGSWKASNGKNDPSQRQLVLLKEMLNNAEAVFSTDNPGFESSLPDDDQVEYEDREWRWGDMMNSTVTLPPSDLGHGHGNDQVGLKKKKKRISKIGNGLREMLKMLKRSYGMDDSVQTSHLPPPPPPPPLPPPPTLLTHPGLASSAMLSSFGAGSSNHHHHHHNHSRDLPKSNSQQQSVRRRPKTSYGPEDIALWRGGGREVSPNPDNRGLGLISKSPRRPSLASIFRLGTKKNANVPPLPSNNGGGFVSNTDLSLSLYSSSEGGNSQTTSEGSRPATSVGSVSVNGSGGGHGSGSTGDDDDEEEEDWDQLEDTKLDNGTSGGGDGDGVDVDALARMLGVKGTLGKEGGGSTIKLRKKSPYIQPFNASTSTGHLGLTLGSSSSTSNTNTTTTKMKTNGLMAMMRPVSGHGHITPRRIASGSSLSLWNESPSKKGKMKSNQVILPLPRVPRLSNVDETIENRLKQQQREGRKISTSSRISGFTTTTTNTIGRKRRGTSGSVRSMPPQPVFPDTHREVKLAMTPENIKPLLENAKEVYARLGDCIMEIRKVLEGAEGLSLGLDGNTGVSSSMVLDSSNSGQMLFS